MGLARPRPRMGFLGWGSCSLRLLEVLAAKCGPGGSVWGLAWSGEYGGFDGGLALLCGLRDVVGNWGHGHPNQKTWNSESWEVCVSSCVAVLVRGIPVKWKTTRTFWSR